MTTPEEDPVEEIVPLADGRELRVLRPRNSEALIRAEAFVHDEYLPYWAELWPSGTALARHVAVRSLRGARVLELGCGLGLPSAAAAMAGGRVLATDWSPEAVVWARRNAERNGVEIETAVESWTDPSVALERAPWDLVLTSDVLYERRNGDRLLELLPQLGRDVLLADPGRAFVEDFLVRAASAWSVSTTRDAVNPVVAVHHLRALA